MKPHLLLRLRAGSQGVEAASWLDAACGHDGHAPDPRPYGPAVLTPAIDSVLRRHRVGVRVTHEYPQARPGRWSADERAAGLDRVYRLIVRDRADLPSGMVDEIAMQSEVDFARGPQVTSTPLAPPVPVPVRALARSTDARSRRHIGLPEAHRLGEGSPEVVVAVLDTGVDVDHAELAPAVLPGFDFVDIIDGAERFVGDHLDADPDPEDLVGHGTHVAGIIVGRGVGMPRGVVPQCRLLPVRVLGAMRRGERAVGAGLVENIDVALKWAVDQGADVINMSFGLRSRGGGLPHRDVVAYGLRRGVTMVAATGNDGSDRELYYPGALPDVIAVGANDADDEVAAFSTYGPQVVLTAPGADIYSSVPGNRYAFASGTSQAAPFVSGAAAFLQSLAVRAVGERLSAAGIRRLLVRTADRPDARLRTPRGGHGRLNLADAARLLAYEGHRGVGTGRHGAIPARLSHDRTR
ncbi:S8 family serine peptidase [Streptomyces sp. NPDC046925]|uniref:S8 family peptidase n=1 Tax=Streptomyces sp. NPDC046925 TaxID=3155375 RepID=UPI003401B0E1